MLVPYLKLAIFECYSLRRKKVRLKLEASEDAVIPGIWGILTFYMETIL